MALGSVSMPAPMTAVMTCMTPEKQDPRRRTPVE
jgi:hypothetical protein